MSLCGWLFTHLYCVALHTPLLFGSLHTSAVLLFTQLCYVALHTSAVLLFIFTHLSAVWLFTNLCCVTLFILLFVDRFALSERAVRQRTLEFDALLAAALPSGTLLPPPRLRALLVRYLFISIVAFCVLAAFNLVWCATFCSLYGLIQAADRARPTHVGFGGAALQRAGGRCGNVRH